MVEAFSVRGLGPLAESWKRNPPFAGDNEFGNAIADYRQNIIKRYAALADVQGITHDPTKWFADHRSEIEVPGLNPFAQAASLTVLAEYERAASCVEALGALNRWPGRSGVPIEDYLRQWEASCAEIQASPYCPLAYEECWALPNARRSSLSAPEGASLTLGKVSGHSSAASHSFTITWRATV